MIKFGEAERNPEVIEIIKGKYPEINGITLETVLDKLKDITFISGAVGANPEATIQIGKLKYQVILEGDEVDLYLQGVSTIGLSRMGYLVHSFKGEAVKPIYERGLKELDAKVIELLYNPSIKKDGFSIN